MQKMETLAIHGGQPAISQPLPAMYPGGMRLAIEEENAVLEALQAKRLFRYYGPNPGPSKVELLEKAFAEYCATEYCLAVTSGTAALICSLVGLGIGPGDEVIVPAYTWIASASAVLAVGAVPVIAEVDESLTLDPEDARAKISPYTRAILPVHMRGAPCKMAELLELAREKNLLVLEDTAQANGGSYRGSRLGSLGDAGAFSLQFNKMITSGEGGLLITDNEQVWQRALMFHDVVGGQRNHIPEEQIFYGLNFRMPELLGAVGLAQLERLDGLVTDSRRGKDFVKGNLAGLASEKGIQFREINDADGDTGIALVMFLPDASRAQPVAGALQAEGVNAMLLYSPDAVDYHIYRHWSPIMQKRSWSSSHSPWQTHPRRIDYHPEMCPRTLDLLSRAVHIDISPDMSNTQLEELTEALHKVLTVLA
jgi:8-amino-3,8-dideoxy-alpha-D-manno-octulosonate transaminase